MRKWILISIVFGALFVFGVWSVIRRNETDALLDSYQKQYLIHPNDFSYRSLARSLLGESLLFYQVQFPRLPFVHKIDKMVLRRKGGSLVLDFKGLQVNVLETLRQLRGADITNIMHSYVPFQSLEQYPLESLALAGIKEMRVRLTLEVEPLGHNSFQVTGTFNVPKVADGTFSFYLNNVPGSSFFDFVNGISEDVELTLRNKAVLRSYAAYALEIGYRPDDNWQQWMTSEDPVQISLPLVRPLKDWIH